MVIYNVDAIAEALGIYPSAFFVTLISLANGLGRVSAGRSRRNNPNLSLPHTLTLRRPPERLHHLPLLFFQAAHARLRRIKYGLRAAGALDRLHGPLVALSAPRGLPLRLHHRPCRRQYCRHLRREVHRNELRIHR
jgi:hypothetical protein